MSDNPEGFHHVWEGDIASLRTAIAVPVASELPVTESPSDGDGSPVSPQSERPPVDPEFYEDGQRIMPDDGVGRPPVDEGREAARIRDEAFQIGQDVGRASAAAPPEGLDEVQAALPEGWSLMVGYTTECPYCPGWWATASKRPESPADYSKIVTSESDRVRGSHHDATSAEAIRALLRRLSERTDR